MITCQCAQEINELTGKSVWMRLKKSILSKTDFNIFLLTHFVTNAAIGRQTARLNHCSKRPLLHRSWRRTDEAHTGRRLYYEFAFRDRGPVFIVNGHGNASTPERAVPNTTAVLDGPGSAERGPNGEPVYLNEDDHKH
jgi:hypothetical protein